MDEVDAKNKLHAMNLPFCQRWARACTFLLIQSLLIVLYSFSSHYFAIFIVTPLVWFLSLTLSLANTSWKAFQQTCCKLHTFVQTLKSMKFSFAYGPHVLITFHNWTYGDAQNLLSAINKQRWKILVMHSQSWLSELSVRSVLIALAEKFVWPSNLWLRRSDTHFIL